MKLKNIKFSEYYLDKPSKIIGMWRGIFVSLNGMELFQIPFYEEHGFLIKNVNIPDKIMTNNGWYYVIENKGWFKTKEEVKAEVIASVERYINFFIE